MKSRVAQMFVGNAALIVALATAGILGWSLLQAAALGSRVAVLEGTLASTSALLIASLEETSSISATLAQQKTDLEERLGSVAAQVGSISGTVGTLEKLARTDPELLAKYSKVYFLSENYAPERVVSISPKYLYREQNPEAIHYLVWPKLQGLLDDAKRDGIDLFILSAYRSFDEQRALKSAYTVTYGAGSANQFSADQGYSEHQLGTAVDFMTTGQNGQLTVAFENTAAYRWLRDNAHRFGFVLSYPKGNTYYMYEPWHWRYVGIELAAALHGAGKNFYDLDQREIDEYLVHIFD